MARKTGGFRYCLQCEALGHWTASSLIVPAHERRRFAPANFVTFGQKDRRSALSRRSFANFVTLHAPSFADTGIIFARKL